MGNTTVFVQLAYKCLISMQMCDFDASGWYIFNPVSAVAQITSMQSVSDSAALKTIWGTVLYLCNWPTNFSFRCRCATLMQLCDFDASGWYIFDPVSPVAQITSMQSVSDSAALKTIWGTVLYLCELPRNL